MIPWFIVSIVAAIVRPFGWQVAVTATYGRRGADAIHFVRPGGFGPMVTGRTSEAATDRLGRRAARRARGRTRAARPA